MKMGALIMETVITREQSISELLELGKNLKQAMGESLTTLLVKLTDMEADKVSLSTVQVEKLSNATAHPASRQWLHMR